MRYLADHVKVSGTLMAVKMAGETAKYVQELGRQWALVNS